MFSKENIAEEKNIDWGNSATITQCHILGVKHLLRTFLPCQLLLIQLAL